MAEIVNLTRLESGTIRITRADLIAIARAELEAQAGVTPSTDATFNLSIEGPVGSPSPLAPDRSILIAVSDLTDLDPTPPEAPEA